jgi:hypothetical protein
VTRLAAFAFAGWMLSAPPAASGQDANAGSLRIQEFEKRVAGYLKLRKPLEANLPALKPTGSPEQIRHREKTLAARIREARKDARQGDIFSAEIAQEFRRLLRIATREPNRDQVKKSLDRAAPVALQLKVNQEYPSGVPLQSTPPTLLMNLPRLPKELDYRVAGHDLVLRDTQANLVVDLLPGVIL